MTETLHTYSLFHKHRYMLWGVGAAVLFPALSFLIDVADTVFLYKFSIGLFLFYVVLDVFVSRKCLPVRLSEKGIEYNGQVIPYQNIRYIHIERNPGSIEVLDPKQAKIVYGADEELIISSRIRGYGKIITTLNKHGVPSST